MLVIKKEDTANAVSYQETISKNNIQPFEEGLKSLTKPQYDLVYSLIENGDVKITLPYLNK